MATNAPPPCFPLSVSFQAIGHRLSAIRSVNPTPLPSPNRPPYREAECADYAGMFCRVTGAQIQLNRQIMGFLEAFSSVMGGTKVEKTWPGLEPTRCGS